MENVVCIILWILPDVSLLQWKSCLSKLGMLLLICNTQIQAAKQTKFPVDHLVQHKSYRWNMFLKNITHLNHMKAETHKMPRWKQLKSCTEQCYLFMLHFLCNTQCNRKCNIFLISTPDSLTFVPCLPHGICWLYWA